MRPLSLEMALNLKRLQLIRDELRRFFPKEARDVSGKYLKTDRLFIIFFFTPKLREQTAHTTVSVLAL